MSVYRSLSTVPQTVGISWLIDRFRTGQNCRLTGLNVCRSLYEFVLFNLITPTYYVIQRECTQLAQVDVINSKFSLLPND